MEHLRRLEERVAARKYEVQADDRLLRDMLDPTTAVTLDQADMLVKRRTSPAVSIFGSDDAVMPIGISCRPCCMNSDHDLDAPIRRVSLGRKARHGRSALGARTVRPICTGT
jgi:hypothetical protein